MTGLTDTNRPLGVVFITAWLGFPEGLAPSLRVRLLARAMVKAGAHVHVLCTQASERPPVIRNRDTRGEWHGVTFEYTCGTTVRHSSFTMRRATEVRGWLTGAIRLVQLRSAGKLDCVYLWSVYSADVRRAAVVGFLHILGVPVVMELNERPWSMHEAPTLLEKHISPLAGMSGVVSISRFLTRWAKSEAAQRRSLLRVAEIPILVDIAEQPEPRAQSITTPVVVFAGAPAYDSTVHFIIQAMEHVWRRYPSCRLVVTGTGPGDPTAEALKKRLGVHETGFNARVQLAGYLSRHDLLDLYQESRVLLIPLFDDMVSKARFPTKIGEYLASGRPIVTTRVGEIERFFTDRENAFISPPNDSEAYGLRISEALADERLAAKVGAAGREYARTHFQYDIHGDALVEFFSQVSEDAIRARGKRRAT